MGVFGRGRRSEAVEPSERIDDGTVEQAGADPDDGLEAPGRERGPWDVSDVPERGARIDLGALWVPGVDGMALRMEVDPSGKVVTAAALTVGGSSLQLQAFAAPRTEGIWDDIRSEIGASVTKQGGTVDDLPGPFGRELLARVPVRTDEGRTGHRPARFIGVDGPRWFLRGVLTGRAAVDPAEARTLESVFADVVVLRGGQARAPRELLALSVPGRPQAATPADAASAASLLDPFARGPEITEVR